MKLVEVAKTELDKEEVDEARGDGGGADFIFKILVIDDSSAVEE